MAALLKRVRRSRRFSLKRHRSFFWSRRKSSRRTVRGMASLERTSRHNAVRVVWWMESL